MTSTPEDAELLSATDATAAIEQTIKRLRQAAMFNNEFVLRDSEECAHFAGSLQTLLDALKSRLLSPAMASPTNEELAALIDPSAFLKWQHDGRGEDYKRRSVATQRTRREAALEKVAHIRALTASQATETVTREDVIEECARVPDAMADGMQSRSLALVFKGVADEIRALKQS